MSKSRAIGTKAETDVVNYLRQWWRDADRQALSGELDRGDITGVPDVCIQVKGGQKAERAGWAQVRKWLAETEEQARNCVLRQGGIPYIPVLVVKRAGKGSQSVGQWRAIIPGWAVLMLILPDEDSPINGADLGPVEFDFGNVIAMLLRWQAIDTLSRWQA